MQSQRNGAQRPVSLDTFKLMRGEQLHHRERQDAHDDGVMQGFFLGLCAAVLGWFVISGHLVRLLYALVRSMLALDGGA
jgi:hypothetical protein